MRRDMWEDTNNNRRYDRDNRDRGYNRDDYRDDRREFRSRRSSSNRYLESKNIIMRDFLIDTEWVDESLYDLVDPNFVLKNSELRSLYKYVPEDSVIYNTTDSILNKMKSFDKNDYSIRFVVDDDRSGDYLWSFDIKMSRDPKYRIRRIYIEKGPSDPRDVDNPLIPQITNLVKSTTNRSSDDAYTNPDEYYSSIKRRNSTGDDSFALAFREISSSSNNLNASGAAQLYADAIYYSVDFIYRTIVESNKCIEKVNGEYIMCSSLYDILTNHHICVGGINIRPAFEIQNGILNVTMILSFTENLTVKYKGDRDYRANSSIDAVKK